jgi:hypothetical protein
MAKKRRPPVLPREAIDTGPPERARHGGVEVVAIKPGAGHATENVARVLHEHVLDVLWRRSCITDPQYDVGNRFRALWERAVSPGRLTANYTDALKGMGDSVRDTDARTEVLKVIRQMTGEQRMAVIAVCGFSEWPGVAFLQWRAKTTQRAPMEHLRAGLNALRKMWGV